MPDIKLGLTGAETTLPKIRWMGSAPNNAIPQNKQLQRAVMSDGSKRFGEFAIKREWSFVWVPVSAADKLTFDTIHNLEGVLHFQNNWESAAWHDVVIVSFAATPLIDLYGGADIRYIVTMSLEEV